MVAPPKEKPYGQAVSPDQFSTRLLTQFPFIKDQTDLAVAVSGGGDSMALAWLLSQYGQKHCVTLHVLTVDHGLRPEAADEARFVADWTASWSGRHATLVWEGEKPQTRIQEQARAARYHLMKAYCEAHGIKYLFLAHHANDQAETILFRLAKGSGLDGLAGMTPVQIYDMSLSLLRPCLDLTHDDLLATCQMGGIKWIEDLSNVSDRYARIRLRKSMEIMGEEGLTLSRISTLSARLERARKVLEQVTDTEWNNCVISINAKRIVFDYKRFIALQEETAIRILRRALHKFREAKLYPVRLEAVEALALRLLSDTSFSAATLGGCIIRHHYKQQTLSITPEMPVLDFKG